MRKTLQGKEVLGIKLIPYTILSPMTPLIYHEEIIQPDTDYLFNQVYQSEENFQYVKETNIYVWQPAWIKLFYVERPVTFPYMQRNKALVEVKLSRIPDISFASGIEQKQEQINKNRCHRNLSLSMTENFTSDISKNGYSAMGHGHGLMNRDHFYREVLKNILIGCSLEHVQNHTFISSKYQSLNQFSFESILWRPTGRK